MRFLKITLLVFASFGLVSDQVLAQRVHLLYDQSVPQARYAAGVVESALAEQGLTLTKERPEYDHLINIGVNATRLEPEAFSIIPEEKITSIYGGDERGMIYGSFALAEELRNGTALQDVGARREAPHLEFRAIKFNLPWDSYRSSSALDQHMETVRDLGFWEAFLDMMAENRFNAITLWNLHPFTYMIMPKNFPEASPFSPEELAEFQELYRGIFRMARERGIDPYIVNWNIFVSRELAEAHGIAEENYWPVFYGEADTSEVIKRYIRESVTQVLNEYPDLVGIGLTHGEGMGGMTPQERQAWLSETILEGMRLADREARLIHRVPLSANRGSGGSTSADTERLTREAMEALDFVVEPIWVEMKFNWSHAHSTPKLVKVHGGELSDTYFHPEPENYKITWMARNEDFFALRWGVPDFIRAHIANNAGARYVGGYFVGSETYIPAKDYFTAVDAPVDWTYAFERQWLFYKLWGRLLYDPETPDEVFRSAFVRRYGSAAANLLDAYALASATQLRLASAFDATWDFTLYSEGFMALEDGEMKYISVDRLIEQPPLDADFISVADYVAASLSGGSFDGGRVTPPVLVRMLEEDNRKALDLVKELPTADDPSLRYEVADVMAWANLGLHFAEKLKGALALQTYRLQGDEADQRKAIRHLEEALRYWDAVIDITRPLYRDMPLTHNNGAGIGPNDDNLFHWQIVRPQVAMDVEIARKATGP